MNSASRAAILLLPLATFCLAAQRELDAQRGQSEKEPEDDEDLVWSVAPPVNIQQVLHDRADICQNKHLAPGQLNDGTFELLLGRITTVQVAIYIESLSSFRAQTMDFEMDIHLLSKWHDERLKHNHKGPILINDLEISELIWHPELYVVNAKSAVFQTVTTPNFFVLIYADGTVNKMMHYALTLSCHMNFAHFPLDEQECPIIIQSYPYVHTLVNLTWTVQPSKGYPISADKSLRLNEMTIVDRIYRNCDHEYPLFRGEGYWSCLQGSIRMRRIVNFFVIQTYIPSGMLVCTSWVSFWLDPRASAARTMLTITTFLTLVTVAIGAREELPHVNYMNALDIWFTICTTSMFAVLMEYTVVCFYIGRRNIVCFKHKANDSRPTMDISAQVEGAPSLRDILKPTVCRKCADENEWKALRLDYVSRAVFPCGFFATITAYWLFYLSSYFDWTN